MTEKKVLEHACSPHPVHASAKGLSVTLLADVTMGVFRHLSLVKETRRNAR